jgi:hypothetical protein
MAIKSSINNDELTLVLNENDFGVFMYTMKEWNFKDPVSMLGYALTLLSCNDDEGFIIKSNGTSFLCKPRFEILKQMETKLN